MNLESPLPRGSKSLPSATREEIEFLLPAIKNPHYGEYFRVSMETLIECNDLLSNEWSEQIKLSACFQICCLLLLSERNTSIKPLQIAQQLPQIILNLVQQAKEMNLVTDILESITYSPSVTEEYRDSDFVTQNHYGNLFKDFDTYWYYEEPEYLLTQRLVRNGIFKHSFSGKVLDAGCGNGRYTRALAKFSGATLYGIDFSMLNINVANMRNKDSGLPLSFLQADLHRIPFESNTFDVVFSNGVVHHMKNPEIAVQEMIRVLKEGGWGIFKVMPNPGGLHWDLIELMRLILWDSSVTQVHGYFKLFGVKTNIIYYLLDHVLVPINRRYTLEEARELLKLYGAKRFRFLERGADIDRTERIYANEPNSILKFGLGELRLEFQT